MDTEHSFASLPSDIQKEILSLAIGSLQEAIRLQATSKAVNGLVWSSIIQFSDVILRDRSCTTKILARMDKSTVKYIELGPRPPSPKNGGFELNLADFPAVEYLSLDSADLIPMLNNTKLKEAFTNHKTLTSVKCICAPYAQLNQDLISEISQTKKLYLSGKALAHASPTLSYFSHREFTLIAGPAIGGFDGTPTVGVAARNFVLIGTDNGTVSVLKSEDGQLKFKHGVKAHQGRINSVHSANAYPKGNVFIASSDGGVSLWDVGNNFDEPRAALKFTEPIFHVVASLVRKTEIFVVAAGKQTAYFVDLEKEENAVKSVPIGSDIIMVEDISKNKKGFAVYTHEGVYQFTEHGEEISTFKVLNYPSTFFGNSEVHIIPRENSAVVQLVSRSKDVFYEEGWTKTLLGKYDTRAHTGAFVDSLKLVLLSTGFGFEAVDILNERAVLSIGLPVTKKEITSNSYKHVVGIFVQGPRWYVIGSDGKLYTWKVVNFQSEEFFNSVFAENFEKF
jgi:hypothetical protein